MVSFFRRKRGERGENTAEDLIVQELTRKRIEELKTLTALERKECLLIKQELDEVKSGAASEEKLLELQQRQEKEEADRKIAEEEYKKWLVERDAKIIAMKANRLGLLRSPKSVKTPPATPVSIEEKKNENIQSENVSPIETVSIKVEDEAPLEKVPPPVITPSTSPLLTSLLQSPSPSAGAHTSLSLFNSVAFKDLQLPGHPCPSPTTPVTPSQPPLPSNLPISSEDSKEIVKSPDKLAESPHTFPPNMPISSSPTLSRLLEMPNETSLKLPSSSTEIIEQVEAKEKELQVNQESIDSPSVSRVSKDSIEEENAPPEYVESAQFEDTATAEINQTDSTEVTGNVSELPSATDAVEVTSEVSTDKEIKQEAIDAAQPPETPQPDIEVKFKPENDETISTSDPAVTDTPSLSSRSKRKRPASTPVATLLNSRRSGRVRAAKDKTFEDEPSMTEPQTGAKKFTSSSVIAAGPSVAPPEAQIEGAKVRTSTVESVPSSPASVNATGEDAESVKEYKMWKKSIMLLWRQAATHKFSTLFSHPVTDNEAKGYSTVVYRPMDLQCIRKKIENSTIKTTAEFQRDMMLMFQNAIMYNSVNHDVHQMAVEMQKEILEGIEDYIETQKQGNQTEVNNKPRGRRGTSSTSEVGKIFHVDLH